MEIAVVVFDVEAVGGEAIDFLDLGAGGLALKPPGAAPRILVGDLDQFVFDCVLVNVVETGVIAVLKGEMVVPKVVSDLPVF
ncbi:hypothetical protein [Roseibacillus persicicus]|uniref:hypothetical protein n=1 Tax=Roseibacillus persicicus TaxID=454148 RepID=UPI0028120D4A|nr:hypothetical protein [Roseibacillus persicicus]